MKNWIHIGNHHTKKHQRGKLSSYNSCFTERRLNSAGQHDQVPWWVTGALYSWCYSPSPDLYHLLLSDYIASPYIFLPPALFVLPIIILFLRSINGKLLKLWHAFLSLLPYQKLLYPSNSSPSHYFLWSVIHLCGFAEHSSFLMHLSICSSSV